MPDGSVDESFGTGGKAVLSQSRFENTEARSLVIQEDGKIITGGLKNTSSNDVMLTRFLPDGSIDSSYGNNGVVISDLTANASEYVNDLALQPDGKLVAVVVILPDCNHKRKWSVPGIIRMVRWTQSLVIMAFQLLFLNISTAKSLVLQPDGKIILGGVHREDIKVSYSALCRLTPEGILDSTFASNGKQVTFINTIVESKLSYCNQMVKSWQWGRHIQSRGVQPSPATTATL